MQKMSTRDYQGQHPLVWRRSGRIFTSAGGVTSCVFRRYIYSTEWVNVLTQKPGIFSGYLLAKEKVFAIYQNSFGLDNMYLVTLTMKPTNSPAQGQPNP